LGLGDETIDLWLNGFDDEVHSIGYSDGMVVWEKVTGEVGAEGLGNMTGRDSKGT
jgi:hypothetical protein